MSTTTIAEPEVFLRPSDDGRRTRIRRRVALAVLGLTVVSGLALAAGADSTRTSPAPVPVVSEPTISPASPQNPTVLGGCLADVECYGESQLVLNNPAPQQPAAGAGLDQNEPTYSPAD